MNVIDSYTETVYTSNGQPIQVDRRIVEFGIDEKTRIMETIIFNPYTNDIVVSQIMLGESSE